MYERRPDRGSKTRDETRVAMRDETRESPGEKNIERRSKGRVCV